MTIHEARPVVVAVDGHDYEAALGYAAREAVQRDCGLRIVHAHHVLPSGPDSALLDLHSSERIASAALRLAVEDAAELVRGRVPLTSRLVSGPIASAVVEAGADASLLVLQRRPRPRVAPVVAAATTGAVAAHARVPVACVPSTWRPGADRAGRVTVGVDVPERSAGILEQALLAARARGASLRVVHTWWFPGGYDDLIMARVGAEAFSQRDHAEIDAVLDELRAGFPDVDVEVDVRHGRPAERLLEASRDSELLVIGRHDPLVPLGSHLGPVARAVLRESGCPVLLLASTGAHPRPGAGRLAVAR
jgi:nucleotide-binding universal stress UspA family protein